MDNEAASAAPAGEAVISPSVESAPQSLGGQTVPKEQSTEAPKAEAKPEPKQEVAKSAREAISRANQAVKDKAEAKPAPVAKAETAPSASKEEAKPDRSRDQTTGQFSSNAPKADVQAPEQQTRGQSEGNRYEAPARFNQQAKTDWVNASDSVKAETLRAIKELEDGHTKYKVSSERYEQFRNFDETAKSNGRDLTQSLQQVVEFEAAMRTNPMAAIDFALRHAGPRKSDGSPLTLNDIVQHVSGQGTDKRLADAQKEINSLRQEIQKRDTEAKIPEIIDQFRGSHPRFDELTPVIVPLLEAGHSLETAYKLADALRPHEEKPLIPAKDEAQAQTLATTKAVNPAGLKSVSGNPSAGSNPSTDRNQIPLKETPSIKDSLRKALSQAS